MRALKRINIKDILFFDIETSTRVKELEIDTPLFNSWEYKMRKNGETDKELVQMYEDQAALYADFGRIVCISVGMLGKNGFKTTTFNNLDEKVMIQDFYGMLDKLGNKAKLCGHAIKSFDIPYVAQRGMAHNLIPHDMVDTGGLKPWELDWILDTKDLWTGTSFNRSSLINVTTVLGLPSPKDDLKGKDVPKYFWENPTGHIQRISEYCERDVVAVYDVVNYLKGLGTNQNTPIVEDVPTPLLTSLFEGAPYGKKEKTALVQLLKEMTDEEREKTFIVLDSVTSAAKGKKTKMTKTHVKALKKELNE